jgi:hypothetical protein
LLTDQQPLEPLNPDSLDAQPDESGGPEGQSQDEQDRCANPHTATRSGVILMLLRILPSLLQQAGLVCQPPSRVQWCIHVISQYQQAV